MTTRVGGVASPFFFLFGLCTRMGVSNPGSTFFWGVFDLFGVRLFYGAPPAPTLSAKGERAAYLESGLCALGCIHIPVGPSWLSFYDLRGSLHSQALHDDRLAGVASFFYSLFGLCDPGRVKSR